MADIRILEVPKWGLSMEEGTVTKWLIDAGQSFAEGDEICEIETSKIANVVEAPFAGTLRKIIAQPGETLPVQAPIGLSAEQSVSDDEVEAFADSLSSGSGHSPSSTSSQSDASDAGTSYEETIQTGGSEQQTSQVRGISIPEALRGTAPEDSNATPHAIRIARQHGIDLSKILGTGRHERVTKQDLIRSVAEAGGNLFTEAPSIEVPSGARDDRDVPATPLARSLARRFGVSLANCSNGNGKVTADAVEAYVRAKGLDEQPAIEPPPGGEQKASDENRLSGMRRTIATRLQSSKQEAPHYRVLIECEMDRLLALREKINDAHKEVRVSVNDLIVKAAASALVRVPACNIQFDGETVRTFDHAHVCVAVALENGLITPRVDNADLKGLLSISQEIKTLVTKAKAGTLTPDEFEGGTFTVSNLGMFGVKHFDAIINPPQGATLAVGASERRKVLGQDDQEHVATICSFNMASDHRVIDGAVAAQFLQTFKSLIEEPSMMLV